MNEFLAGILSGINSVIHNYGWSMVIFTLLIKLLVLPLDYKSRKSMRSMTKLQPEMQKLQKKYANDKEKLNQKSAELYRRAGVSPMSGCLPMIISMAILWIMFAAMRLVANTEMAKQVIDLLTTGTQTNEGWLWIKNIWLPDSPFASVIADSNSLKMIPADVWSKVYAALSGDQLNVLTGLGITAETISSDTVFAALQTLPVYAEETALWATMPTVDLFLFKIQIFAHNNGWFVLPILAAVTQLLMTNTTQQAPAADPSQQTTNKFMKYFFPIFSLWICSSYNAIFALYWVVSNIFAWIENIALNKIFDNQEAKTPDVSGEAGALK